MSAPCECGQWSGVRCEWSGPESHTVVVEYIPAQHRADHAKAGNLGTYPANGASRIRVSSECAESIMEHDGDWARVVES